MKSGDFGVAFICIFLTALNLNVFGAVIHTYDNLNRLATTAYSDGTLIDYTYDPAGNRLTQTITVVAPTVFPAGITTQPANQAVTVGANAAFTVAASGTPMPTLQWQVSTDSGSSWSDLANNNLYSGATTGTLNITGATSVLNNYQYRCVATNNSGSAISTAAVLTAVNTALTIITQPESLKVDVGANAIFSVVATGTSPPTYQWQFNGLPIAGAISATLTITNVQRSNAGAYRVMVSNSQGSATSVEVSLNVNSLQPPIITVAPKSQTVIAGAATTFNVSATGTALAYQWRFNAVAISGANSPSLNLPNAQQIHVGSYDAVVSNAAGTVTSVAATLTVTTTGVRGDIDGDGTPDLLFQDSNGGLAAWLMNGATLSSARFLTPENVGDRNWRIVGSGDFNEDSQEDLVFQHTDGTLAVWIMNGVTRTSGTLLNPSNPGDRNWRVAATGDVDKDGKADLVFQHTDGTLAVWFMDGINLKSAAVFNPSNPGDTNWKVVGTGDFDADVKLDLLFQHTDGTLAVWFLDGTALSRASLLSPSNSGAEWRVVSAVDRNGDGKPDLLFQHTNLDLAVWIMDGTKLSSAQYLNPRNSRGTWKVVAPK